MNISRIALLSVLFTVAPATCIENDPVQSTAPSILSKITSNAKSCVTTPVNAITDSAGWIANTLYLEAAIKCITTTKYLNNTFINHPKLIGKAIVLTAATILAYQAYIMHNTQDVDTDEDIFGDDEYSTDNNY